MLVRVRSTALAFAHEGRLLPAQVLSPTTRAVLLDRIPPRALLVLHPADGDPAPARAVAAGPGWLKGPRLRLDVLPDGALTLIDRVDGVRWPLLATVRKRERLRFGSSHEGPLVGSVSVDSPGLRLRASLRAGEDRIRLRIAGGPPDRVKFPIGVEPTTLLLGDRSEVLAPGVWRHPGLVAAVGGMRDLGFLTPPGSVCVQRTRRQGFVLAFPLPPVFRCVVCRPEDLAQADEDRRLPVVQVPPGFSVPERGNVRVRRRGGDLVLRPGRDLRELLLPGEPL